jgi:hypothetical protein
MKETMVPSTPIPMIFLVEGMFNLAWLWHWRLGHLHS